MPRFINKTVTIQAGESLSGVVDCSTGAPVAIHMPSDWTPSRLTFRISPESTNFYDLFDTDAREIGFNINAGTSVVLKPEWTPVMYFKIRSGSRDLPVPQEMTRVITITIDTQAAI